MKIEENQISKLQIKNEKKKGQIEIHKVDAENNEYGIQGVEFVIINERGETVEKLTTDEKGYAISSRLPIGNYSIKEIRTNAKYILNDEIIKVEIKENKINNLKIEKEKIKIMKIFKELPKTGM